MLRKLRLVYENAIYHVINRGNYRVDVFSSQGAAQAFEKVMFEAVSLKAPCICSDAKSLSLGDHDANAQFGGGDAVVAVDLRGQIQSISRRIQ